MLLDLIVFPFKTIEMQRSCIKVWIYCKGPLFIRLPSYRANITLFYVFVLSRVTSVALGPAHRQRASEELLSKNRQQVGAVSILL